MIKYLKNFIPFFIAFLIPKSMFAISNLKKDNPISLSIITGLNFTKNPVSPNSAAAYYNSFSRKHGFFPFGGINTEARFCKIFGISLNTVYINRNFSLRNDHDLSLINFSSHCIELGLFLSIYPSGFHGLLLYLGPKVSFNITNNSSWTSYDGKKLTIDEEKKIDLKKFNWGVTFGTRAEIDRTGFFFGGEVDYLFNSARIEKEIPAKIEQNSSSLEYWKEQENKNKLYFFSCRLYIGYDFLRKYFCDYNF